MSHNLKKQKIFQNFNNCLKIMKKEEFDQMNKMEEEYWWHKGRRLALSKILQKYYSKSVDSFLILDFGCGTGGNFKFLSEFGKVYGVDNSKDAIDYCKSKNQLAKLIDGQNIPFQKNSIDLITVFDVLEHIDDDCAIIRECHRVLKSKKNVLITVPAYKFLWSDHDEVLGHYRRYTLKELRNKFEKNGFKTIKLNYFVTLLFPLILIYRTYRIAFSKYLDKKTSYVKFPKLLNIFFTLIMKTEVFLLNKINFPFGCSVVAIFEKKD